MSLRTFVEAFPLDAALTLVDAGSAGGIHARWRPFAPILIAVGFDPREREPKGELRRGGTRIYPVALADKPGSAQIHITRYELMSSMLMPNRELLGAFRKKLAHTEIVSSPTVAVDTLDAIAARDGFAPDVLKIDTQGSEGLILDGARRTLEHALIAAEVEVSFMERYVGQALFEDVHARMKAAGFRLIDLTRLKRYRAANRSNVKNVSLGFGQRAGALSSADAVFVRHDEAVLERAQKDGGVTLLRAIAAMIAYGKPDIAARFFDLGEALLAPELRPPIAATLRGLAGRRLGLRRLHYVADRVARKL